MNLKKYIYILSFIAGIFIVSCSADYDFDMEQKPAEGENEIVFNLTLDNQGLATRADLSLPYFGDGSKVDLLIFAVYEKVTAANGNITYKLLEEYSKTTEATKGVTPGPGQNIIDLKSQQWPVQIKIGADLDKSYRLAIWVQHSGQGETDFNNPFDAKDLTAVKVDYSKFVLNDDRFDAFCKYVDFKGSDKRAKEVLLRRAFAQLNFGCAGWDYEVAAAMPPVDSEVKYTQSKVAVSGVANIFNAVTGVTSGSTDVTFDYNTLPAFQGLTDQQVETTPYNDISTNTLLKVKAYSTDPKDPECKPNIFEQILEDGFFPYVSWNYLRGVMTSGNKGDNSFSNKRFEIKDNEEVLSLTSGQIYDRYPDYRPHTEIFKYMAMCYLLVPENGTLNSVSFKSKGFKVEVDADGKENLKSDEPIKESQELKLRNIPVQRNWRTNIVSEGGFFAYNLEFRLYVIPDYCGEYDNTDGIEGSYDDQQGGGWWNVGFEDDNENADVDKKVTKDGENMGSWQNNDFNYKNYKDPNQKIPDNDNTGKK